MDGGSIVSRARAWSSWLLRGRKLHAESDTGPCRALMEVCVVLCILAYAIECTP